MPHITLLIQLNFDKIILNTDHVLYKEKSFKQLSVTLSGPYCTGPWRPEIESVQMSQG